MFYTVCQYLRFNLSYTVYSNPDPNSDRVFLWMPALTFSHTILFLVGLWALVDKESVEAIISVSLSSVVCILVLVIYCSQYIVVVAFTILLDIVQLGLYFPSLQSINGGGGSKHFMKLHDVIVLMHYFISQVKLLVPGSSLLRILTH